MLQAKVRGSVQVIIIVIVLLLVGTGFYLYKSGKLAELLPSKLAQTISVIPSPLFEGKVERLSEDLGLLSSEFDTANSFQPFNIYYKAGTFTRGKYKDYSRIILVTTQNVPYSSNYVFATKDNKVFILLNDEKDSGYMDTLEKLKSYGFDTTKVTSVDSENYDDQKSLTLDQHFGLYRTVFFTTGEDLPESLNKKVQYGYQKNVLKIDRANLTELKTDIPGVQVYQENPIVESPVPTPSGGLDDNTVARNKYLGETTRLIVFDNTGVGYMYRLASTSKLNSYKADLEQYTKTMDEYNKSVITHDQKVSDLESQGLSHDAALNKADEISPYTKYPLNVDYPGLGFTKSDLTTTETNLYESYSVAFPGGCGGDVGTYLINNISDSDMAKIGKTANFDTYVLKDRNHPLYRLEYDAKIGYGIQDPENFIKYSNPGKTIPTFEEYVAKNPLIFAKDYWGRWFVVGEYDWVLPGGCGKPVIYLYPQKEMSVSLKFNDPMKLDVAIPSYKDGWNVIAELTGVLHNQNPENCKLIDSTRLGSEYAKSACLTNSYPYIYWAGQSLQNAYPKVDGGWVVARGDLANVLGNKLDSIGFTSKEKSDMLSYWVPKMLTKNSPYYRVSFLNTEQLNSLFPMSVSPRPDFLYRTFLDWEPLDSFETIVPQNLQTIHRNGFFMLEWGGLNR